VAIGDFARAFDEFALSVDLQPNNAWVYFNRAQAHEKKRDYSNAFSDYKKALATTKPKLPAYKRKFAESRVQELSALGFGGKA